MFLAGARFSGGAGVPPASDESAHSFFSGRDGRTSAPISTFGRGGEITPTGNAHSGPEVECNCVVVTQGGEQQETMDQSVGNKLDSAVGKLTSLLVKGEVWKEPITLRGRVRKR